MRIKQLTLEHFRGVQALTLDFKGQSAIIRGANGTGKTTVANAIAWLLTDAPITGEAGFSPEPAGGVPSGERCRAEMTIEAADGALATISKTVSTGKRGGRETSCAINSVPLSATEYRARIESIMRTTTERARLLLSPGRLLFAGREADRRDLLLSLTDPVNDKAAIAATPTLADLPGILDQLSATDWAAKATLRRKELDKQLSSLTARIDEAAQTASVQTRPVDEIQKELTAAQELTAAGIDAGIRTQLALARTKWQEDAASLDAALNDAIRRQDAATRNFEAVSDKLSRIETDIVEMGKKRQALIDEWERINAEEFNAGDGTCPTCGQMLLPAMIEESRARFEAQRESRLATVNDRGAAVSQQIIASLEQQAGAVRLEVAQRKSAVMRATAETDTAKRSRQALPSFDDTPVARELTAKLGKDVAATAKREDTLAGLQKDLAMAIAAQNAVKRIGKLKEMQKSATLELDEVERGLALCSALSRAKATLVESRVNGRFEGVRWRLVREQSTGALAPCCEAMLRSSTGDWVSWRSGNTAGQVAGECEMSAVMGQAWGAELPVIIDRAESVSKLPRCGTRQVIALMVSADAHALAAESVAP